jgi:hypothetical protein
LYIQASYRLDPDYSADADVPIGQAVTGRAVLDRRPVALSDVACISPDDNLVLDPQRRALLARLARHFRALLAVPLIDKNDQSYGTVTLYYREPHTFSDEEIQLCHIVRRGRLSGPGSRQISRGRGQPAGTAKHDTRGDDRHAGAHL